MRNAMGKGPRESGGDASEVLGMPPQRMELQRNSDGEPHANKAAEEAARDAEGAWPLDEEGHLIEEPNLFDIKFDDAYTEVPSGPWAETLVVQNCRTEAQCGSLKTGTEKTELNWN